MAPISRGLILLLAFSALSLPLPLRGETVVKAGKPAGTAVSPRLAQGWANSIGGYFGSRVPDMTILSAVLPALKGVDFRDPRTREALGPVFAQVQFQAQKLLPVSAGAPAAAVTPALVEKFAVLDEVFRDFLPLETRTRVSVLSRIYRDALSREEQENIRAKMEDMAKALGRTAERTVRDDAQAAIVAASDSPREKMPDSWTLQPAPVASADTTPAPDLADSLAAGILRGSASERWAIFTRVGKANDPELVKGVWAALVRPLSDAGPLPGASADRNKPVATLTKLPLTTRWHKDSKQSLERRMPTLVGILGRPEKLQSFLLALSFLRAVYPFDLNRGGAPPIAWSREHGVSFQLNELRVVPVSQSFRRHILYVEDVQGRYAVQLKMPGQDSHRYEINTEHFTAAQDLWDRFPDDPGVVRPLYFGRFAGTAKLYNLDLRFSPLKPLGIAVWEYEDGLRLYPKPPLDSNDFPSHNEYYKAVEQWYGNDPAYLASITDAAVTAVRLHNLGWRGSDTYEKRRFKFRTDMHPGNVIRGADGRTRLVADFGAFRKTWLGLGMSKRRMETLSLLGHPPREALARIAPEVARRVAENVQDAARRRRIEREVLEELGIQ